MALFNVFRAENHLHIEIKWVGTEKSVLPCFIAICYTCQRFLRYRHEIFILGVLGFLKTTRSFPKISEDFRRFPKISEEVRRRPKFSEDVGSLPKSKLSRKRLATRTDVS